MWESKSVIVPNVNKYINCTLQWQSCGHNLMPFFAWLKLETMLSLPGLRADMDSGKTTKTVEIIQAYICENPNVWAYLLGFSVCKFVILSVETFPLAVWLKSPVEQQVEPELFMSQTGSNFSPLAPM